MNEDAIVRLKASLSGRYEIEGEIGAGGMATVYLAMDLKHHRKVAVKVLHPELASLLGAERFLNEIRVTAGLQHPHILALHDSGEADSFLYFIMPYVEGESLRSRLMREGALPIPEAVELLREIADGLAYAHERGVVHRDIKPDNVLLSGRHALLADLGIAKAVSDTTPGANSPPWAWWWGPRSTWPRSKPLPIPRWTIGPISILSGSWPTRCSRAGRRSAAGPGKRSWRPSFWKRRLPSPSIVPMCRRPWPRWSWGAWRRSPATGGSRRRTSLEPWGRWPEAKP
jgi:serine/threonine protein kinase